MNTGTVPPPASVDVSPLLAAAERIDALVGNGWSAADLAPVIRLTNADMTDARAALVLLEEMAFGLVEVRLVGSRHGHTLTLRRVGSNYEVDHLPEARPEDLFDDPNDLARAAYAWDRDTEAALDLPFRWQITADLGLERLLSPPSDIELRVARNAASVTQAIIATPLTLSHLLIPADGTRRVYLALDAPPEPLHLGSISFAGLPPADDSTSPITLALPAAASPLPGETAGRPFTATVLPLPITLLPMDISIASPTWQAVGVRCQSLAALLTWAFVASDVAVTNNTLRLDFRGFKRVTLDLPEPAALSPQSAAGAMMIRSWAFHDASPDRLLALRQVVSLYQEIDAILHPEDVLDSAEVVYTGLRSEAVAEVIRSTRDAQGQILDTVRQTLKSVQDLAKSATERFFAALVGLAAVIVANAHDSLTNRAGRDLMLGVAIFLAVLAVIAIVLEGPLLSLPLDNLDADLRSGTPLLTEDQRNQLTALPSVAATRQRVFLLRVLIPSIHLTLALLILWFGFPSRYR